MSPPTSTFPTPQNTYPPHRLPPRQDPCSTSSLAPSLPPSRSGPESERMCDRDSHSGRTEQDRTEQDRAGQDRTVCIFQRGAVTFAFRKECSGIGPLKNPNNIKHHIPKAKNKRATQHFLRHKHLSQELSRPQIPLQSTAQRGKQTLLPNRAVHAGLLAVLIAGAKLSSSPH